MTTSIARLASWALGTSLALGCNGKLHVDGQTPDTAGSGGSANAVGGSESPGTGGTVGGSAGFGTTDIAGSAGSGFAGATAGSGGVLGVEGAPCIAGGLQTEAPGTIAEAQIRTLDHCNDGLACNSGTCVQAPDCPATISGICVVYRSSGGGGAGGAGSAGSGASAGSGGSAGISGNGNQNLVGVEAGVMAMVADDSNLYWVDYGTRDALGNYQSDGALSAYAFASGATTTIASSLPGPIDLGVTTTRAYVSVDGAPLVGSPSVPRILRVPLSGGASETLQNAWAPALSRGFFTSVGDQAFIFDGGDQVITITANDLDGAEFLDGVTPFQQLTTDGTYLYCTTTSEIVRAAVAGYPYDGGIHGVPQEDLVSPANDAFAVTGDSLYGLETADLGQWVVHGSVSSHLMGILLDTAPKTGGLWKRTRAFGEGSSLERLQFIGDRFFFLERPGDFASQEVSVVVATQVPSDPAVRLLERPEYGSYIDQLWVGTPNALFWSDGKAIYKRSLDAL